jgi:hypothetical protein
MSKKKSTQKYSDTDLRDKVKENPFPVVSLDPKEKEKNKYGRQIAKYIYYNGLTEDYSSERRTVAQENRDYASNRQDINKYKGLLDAEIDNQGDKSYMNIDWSIQTPGKKYVDTIIGDMINQDHKIQFNAIDNNAKKETRRARDEYYGQIVRSRDIAQLEEMSGLALEKKNDLNLANKEEVDIYMDLEYKQAIEIGMETIVDYELEMNEWDTKLKARLIRDLVENNKACARLYFDKNNKIGIRYVDAPLNYYSSYTDEPDHSDVEYQAEIKYMSIGELRKRDIYNEVSEEQWFKMAKNNQSKYGNAAWRFGGNYNNTHEYNGMQYSYSDYRVEVVDFVFYTVDRMTYAESEDKYGGKHMTRKPHGYKKPERSRKKIEVMTREMEMSYEGVWVASTDVLMGYGRSQNILRPKVKEGKSTSPKLLRKFVYFEPNVKRGVSSSFVDVIKPNLDNIQILVLRKRHLVAEMNPTGVAIDISGMSDVMTALKEKDPKKIIKMYKQKGILPYSRTDINGEPSNGVPIHELGTGFVQSLIGLDQAIMTEIEHIRSNGGINDARDGSSPDKDALVGIEKMRLLASNNTTREMYKAFLDGIYAQVGQVAARMVQYKVEYGGGIKEYDNVIGEQGVKSIEFAKDITMSQLGIKIEALPTDEEVDYLLNLLNVSLQNQDLRPEDVLEIKRVLNIKKAERLLIYRRKVYAEEKMAEFQQKEEITAEREKASALAAAEASKIKAQAEAEATIEVEREKARLKREEISWETNNKLKEIDREGYWKERLIEKQQEGAEETSVVSVDAPKVLSNPGEAATRHADVTP